MLLPALVLVLPVLAQAGAPRTTVSSVDVSPAPGVASVVTSGVPPIPPDFTAWADRWANARSALLADVDDRGRTLLVKTRFANSTQLHRVAVPLGMREQLTFDREPVSDARFQPGDETVVWLQQDTGGGEFFQLYRLDLRTGNRQLVTDGKSRHESFTLSRDGRRLAYSGTGRNGTDVDVYLADTATPTTAQRLTEEKGEWKPLEFSDDGRRLLVVQTRAIDDGDLWIVDLSTRERTRVTPDPATAGKGAVRAARFAPDGKSVYVVTDRDADVARLVKVVPGATWKPAVLTADLRWNVEELDVAPDGTVAFATNEDGYSKLYVLKDGKRRSVPVPAGVLASMTFPRKASDTLVFAIDTPTSPTDVWSLALRTGTLVRWTRSEVGAVQQERLVTPTLVRYPSTDGVEVPAFLYLPRTKPAGGKFPVVVLWHGGPEAQERPVFSTAIQSLVDLGMAVLAPNVRGSDGYGKRYLALDDGVRREQALKDIGATLDFVASRPDLDASRVAARGGSYGGYMTLASIAFYPDRFRAAVDVVGISNLVTFLQNTQAYRRDLRRVEYGDERVADVRAVQERISPLNSADRIKAELYVQQGRNDPRVPQSEAEQIVRALRGKGKAVWYLLALEEGHGFKKKDARDFAWTSSLWFLREKLLVERAGPSGAGAK